MHHVLRLLRPGSGHDNAGIEAHSMKNAPDSGGFSLVEVIIAMLFLMFVIIGFMPVYSFVQKSMLSNRVKVVAYNLAKDTIEQVRSMRYADVGTYPVDEDGDPLLNADGTRIMGDPGGNIPSDKYTIVDGVNYKVETTISWVDDPQNGVGQDKTSPDFNPKTYDPYAADYKKVVVTVSAPGLPKITTQTIDLHTFSSQEGEETATPGGNILVEAVHGWSKEPASSVEVYVYDGPDVLFWNRTDDKFGKVLFHALTPKDYVVHADASAEDMMVRPISNNSSDVTVTVINATTKLASFEVDQPCHLSVELRDNINPDSHVTSGATAYLYWPSDMKSLAQETYNITAPNYQISDFGPIWPVGDGWLGNYDILVQASGYRDYKLMADHVNVWDGKFSGPDDTKNLVFNLVPLTNVTVTDSVTGNGITGATVKWFTDTYNYESGIWTGPVPSGIEAGDYAITGANGIAYLPDGKIKNDEEKPGSPVDGATFTCYGILVYADGYYDGDTGINYKFFSPAFWVKETQQMYASTDLSNPGDAQINNRQATCAVQLDPIIPETP